MGSRTAGEYFGDLELLHGKPRRFTAESHGTVELIRIDEEHFNLHLRDIYLKEWDHHRSIIRNISAFVSWPDEEYQTLYDNIALLTFRPGQTLLADVEGEARYVYFVVEGECRMSKDMVFKKYRSPRFKFMYSLPSAREESMVRQRKYNILRMEQPEYKFCRRLVHLTKLENGHFFGVGENLSDIQITAITTVLCVSVPRTAFEKLNKRGFLANLQHDVESAWPSDKRILTDFIASEKWEYHREQFTVNDRKELEALDAERQKKVWRN